jgi:lipopolysaccharide biosynthesis glycosyltransferase
MIRVFIGYDPNEIVAWHVLTHSILKHSTSPISFIPIAKNHIKDLYNKPKQGYESTEFSMTRFLTPYLSDYRGWSIFLDCDMLVTSDITELWDLRDDRYAVMCTKHDYTPSTSTKFLNQTQSKYEKKNWSSVMMFNNAKCWKLTPKVVSSESGMHLHQFKWLSSDDEIGSLPLNWNYLVGEEEPSREVPNLIHYTLGGPYFIDYRDVDYAELWNLYYADMKNVNFK